MQAAETVSSAKFQSFLERLAGSSLLCKMIVPLENYLDEDRHHLSTVDADEERHVWSRRLVAGEEEWCDRRIVAS